MLMFSGLVGVGCGRMVGRGSRREGIAGRGRMGCGIG